MTQLEIKNKILHISIFTGDDLALYLEHSSVIQVAVDLGLLSPIEDAWLDDICVHEGLRGRGLGLKALQIQESNLRNIGIRRIVGLFNPEYGYDEELKNWYERQGYIFVNKGVKYIYKDLQ